MAYKGPTGLLGWPLVPSKRFPGELTLACPQCLSTNVTMTLAPGGRGTGPGGQWRMGDPSRDLNRCEDCKFSETGTTK